MRRYARIKWLYISYTIFAKFLGKEIRAKTSASSVSPSLTHLNVKFRSPRNYAVAINKDDSRYTVKF